MGAGSSRAAGAPIMRNFLETSELIFRSAGSKYDLVFEAISRLQQVHSKADLDLYNLESVFGAFEMARMIDRRLLDNGASDTTLVPLLKEIIAETLQRSIAFPIKQYSEARYGTPEPDHFEGYNQLTEIVVALMEQRKDYARHKRRSAVAFITMNYDVILEWTLLASDIGYTYCTAEEQREQEESGLLCPPVLKLHGSVNWTECSECNGIVPIHINSILRRRRGASFDRRQLIAIGFDQELKAAQAKHCRKQCANEPMIVPPTWNKLHYARSVGEVWKRAAQELAEAENVFVFGYSLPDTDVFFKHFFALGSLSDRLMKRFWVFDPDKAAKDRWRSLLGPATLSRFQHFEEPFPKSLDTLRSSLNI
jgi:hypothetical protein